MAKGKIRSFVGAPGGGGTVEFEDGSSEQVDARPQPNEFVEVKGVPRGDFIQDPVTRTFEPMGRGTARNEFFGEALDREAQADRVMAAKLGARMGAKQKIDEQGRTMGYTVVQKRRQNQISDARAKLESEFAEQKHTPDQMKQFEKQLAAQEAAILPQMITQPPSTQQQFESNLVKMPNGSMGLYNAEKNTVEPIEVGKTMTFKEWNEGIKTMREVMTTQGQNLDDPTKDIVPTPKEVRDAFLQSHAMYQQSMGVVSGADTGQQEPPPAQPAQAQQPVNLQETFDAGVAGLGKKADKAEMQSFGEQFVAEAVQTGMTAEQAIDTYMDLWKNAQRKKGSRKVSGPGFTSRKKLVDIAEQSELAFLEAKERQQ